LSRKLVIAISVVLEMSAVYETNSETVLQNRYSNKMPQDLKYVLMLASRHSMRHMSGKKSSVA
jgi:hypothetical protein